MLPISKIQNESNLAQINHHDHHSIVFLIIQSLFIPLLFILPFQKALFNGGSITFDRPLYSFILLGAIILFCLSFLLFRRWKFNDHRDLLSIFIWLVPLSYVLSNINAASAYASSISMYLNFVYVVLFLAAAYTARSKYGLQIILTFVMSSGYLIVLYGFMNFFGNVHFTDAVWGNALRFASVFQYPNTYSAFLLALLLCAVYIVLSSRNKLIIALHGAMVIPITVSFLLTLSRGGLVVLPVVLLIVLFFLRFSKQLFFLLHIIFSFVLSLLISNKVSDFGFRIHDEFSSSTSLKAWLFMILFSLLFMILIYFIQRFLEPYLDHTLMKWDRYRFSQFFIPIIIACSIIMGLFILFSNSSVTQILPDNIQKRVEKINLQENSVLERSTFYKDAIKMVKDNPVFGSGGGAWSALYEKYQNNPYTSKQAHNFFVQYLAEVGFFGLIILLGLWGFILFRYIKYHYSPSKDPQHFVFFIFIVSILLHSMIDFNMSYAYLSALIFICFGVLTSPFDQPFVKQKQIKYHNDSRWNKLYPTVLLILSVVLIMISSRLLTADLLFKSALANNQANVNEILLPLNKAIELNETHDTYKLSKISILKQAFDQTKDDKYYNEAIRLIGILKKQEPFNYQVYEYKLYFLFVKDQHDELFKLFDDSIEKFPWKPSIYENAINLHFERGSLALENQDLESMNNHWDRAIDYYQQFLDKSKSLETLPEGQKTGEPFHATETMNLTIGKIYFIRGEYDHAANVLRKSIDPKLVESNQRIIARWYLAALQKQNLNDEKLYKQLIESDPTEEDKIEKLKNSEFF